MYRKLSVQVLMPVVLGAGLVNTSAASPRQALQEVIVTAQKRPQELQDIPLSVDVLSRQQLDIMSSAGEDILFLAGRSSSLYAEASSGRTFPRFYIRGLGNTDFDLNANQPVSLVYDGIVLENPILKGFPVFDLDRVEILRGPQGSLFGRNTPAGAIKFESRRPSRELEAYARGSYGRFDTLDMEVAVGGPLTESLSGRLSLLHQQRDDFVDNTFTGGEEGFEEFDEWAGRLQLLYEPDESFSSLLNLHFRALDGGSRTFRANVIRQGRGGLVRDFDRFEAAQDATQVLDVDNFGVSLTNQWQLGAASLISITGYETVEIVARGDVDGGFGADFAPPAGPGSIPFSAETADNIDDHEQFTQEFRVSFELRDDLETTVGLFLFYENLALENLSFDTLAGGVENGRAVQDQQTRAWAAFGSTAWQLSDRWLLQGGLRFSGERKDFSAQRLLGPFGSGTLGPVERELNDQVVSGDLSASYAFSGELDGYLRYARSFRPPNAQGRILFGNEVTTADTESIDSVEVGVKSTFWDDRARVNVSTYYYRSNDHQLTAVGGAGNFNQLLNAEEVVGHGFELDAAFVPAERLELTLAVSLNETEIQDRDLEVTVCAAPCTVTDPVDPATGNARINGNPLPQAPRWITSLTARYSIPVPSTGGKFYLFTDWWYRGRVNFFLYESVEFTSRDLVEGGVRAGYIAADGRWEVAAFGRNVLNDTVIEGAIDFNNLAGFVNEPRVWGLEVSARY